MNAEERQELRDKLRQARRDLNPEQQEAAAKGMHDLVVEQDFFTNASHIAFYQGVDGEINPGFLLEKALAQGKTCYLPTLSENTPDQMSFASFDSATELVENEWGIREPPITDEDVSPTNFDVVFVPLVGFDENCFRLGMGKGFYDRTFSFKIFNRRSRPLLIGLAHKCQLTDSFPTESWDVRLDAVITDEKIYRPDTA
ncbi:MAG: 5-formyltetrahydrofolate cyclo-ligase [Gammaproteobacteria bacterium]|nr:5-formyltetrahydrofolate cyclo-ligase [Gammaproteobacteria bacterium]MDD9894891.1 5-formyltetrahydrofolate cyclo-ligase [Gammaproteobacteria bacterium]MDD9958854.1 5-formyltetrahydrofolate cyclo-ligase [Gammaproteobacteria bacterium]